MLRNPITIVCKLGPRKPGQWLLFESTGLRNRKIDGVNSVSQLNSQAERRTPPLLNLFVLVGPSVHLDVSHKVWGGPSALLCLLIQMLISSENILTDTSRIMFNQISRHPCPSQSWDIKLTPTGSKGKVATPGLRPKESRECSRGWNRESSFQRFDGSHLTLGRFHEVKVRS